MFWIIGLIIVFYIVRLLYLASGDYEVYVKTKYNSSSDVRDWMPIFYGSYFECINYVREAKRAGTHLLGFNEYYKIKRR